MIRDLESKFKDLQKELSKGSYATCTVQYDWLPLPNNLSPINEVHKTNAGILEFRELRNQNLPAELVRIT